MRATQDENESQKPPSFGQAQQLLNLIQQHDPSSEQVQQLFTKGWIFKHLLRLDPKKIEEFDFCLAIGAPIFEFYSTPDSIYERTDYLEIALEEQVGFFSDNMGYLLSRNEISLIPDIPADLISHYPMVIYLIKPTGKFLLAKFLAELEKNGFVPLDNITAFLALLRKLSPFPGEDVLTMIPPRVVKGDCKFHLCSTARTRLDYSNGMFAIGNCNPSLVFPVIKAA